MATNILPQLSVSGNGVGSGEVRTRQLPAPPPVSHPRAKQMLSESELIVARYIICGVQTVFFFVLPAGPSSLRSSGRPARIHRAGAKEKQQTRSLFKDINPSR